VSRLHSRFDEKEARLRKYYEDAPPADTPSGGFGGVTVKPTPAPVLVWMLCTVFWFGLTAFMFWSAWVSRWCLVYQLCSMLGHGTVAWHYSHKRTRKKF